MFNNTVDKILDGLRVPTYKFEYLPEDLITRKRAIAYAELIVKCSDEISDAETDFVLAQYPIDKKRLRKEMERYKTLRNYLIQRIKREG